MTVKVLLVDDAKTARMALRAILEQDPEILVIGEASDADEALRQVRRLRPDLVTMDVLMEGKSGLEATRSIMAECARPIIIVSSTHGSDGDVVYEALALGALEVLPKPPGPREASYAAYARSLCSAIRSLARVPVVTRRTIAQAKGPAESLAGKARAPLAAPAAPRPASAVGGSKPVLLIGASTGGPILLAEILRALGPSFVLPVLVAQHLAKGFIASFASWLATASSQEVTIVGHPMGLSSGRVYLPAEGAHLCMSSSVTVTSRHDSSRAQTPSIDLLFDSAAGNASTPGIAVLLTGMGSDGAGGLLSLRERGFHTIAQSPDSCVVRSMPAAAIARGAVKETVHADALAMRIREVATQLVSRPARDSRTL